MMSTTEAARRLGISPRRVRELAASGVLPARRVGGRFVLSDDAVDSRAGARPAAGRPGHLLADVALAELTGTTGRPSASRRTLSSARSLIASSTTDELARTLSLATTRHELVEVARSFERSRGLERRRAAGVLSSARRSWRERTPRARTTMAQLGRPSARSAADEARRALRDGDFDWALRVILHADASFRVVDDPEALGDYLRAPGGTGDVRLDALLAALTAHSSRGRGLPVPEWTSVDPLDPSWVVRSAAAHPDPTDEARRRSRTPRDFADRGLVLTEEDLERA
jgi:excisionase family DNA binding protein